MRDIIVIGGGAGGLAAAITAKKNSVDVLLIEREETLGGILNQCIHNGFGLEVFKEEYTGPEYAYKYLEEFYQLGIDYLVDTTVTKLEKINGVFKINVSSKKHGMQNYEAKSIIMSTGCYERTRGQIMMPGSRPAGVITAGSAQRYLNIDGFMVGKKVFILGSGDIGLIMARRMVLEGAEVLGVAEIMPYSNGLTRNIVQCLNDFDIPLFLSHTVTNVIADDTNRLKAIEIKEVDESFNPKPGTEKIFEVDTLLLSIGLIPDITLLDDLGVEIDKKTRSAKINQAYETNISGLFICGNSLQVHDLVDNVSKESERAAECASFYINNSKEEPTGIIEVNPGQNVLYVTPQKIDFSWKSRPLIVSFRSTKKIEKALCKVVQNNEVIYQRKLLFVVPAEMKTLKFNYDSIDTTYPLTVSLEELV